MFSPTASHGRRSEKFVSISDQELQERTEALIEEVDPHAVDQFTFRGAQFDAGLALVHFPEGKGGLGLSRGKQAIVDEVLREAKVPYHDLLVNPIGIGMGAAVVLNHGTEEMHQKHLKKIFTGEDIWCQLFSEPTHGSDVAGIPSKAIRDGDEWIVNGQKIWTSGAHYSDYGVLVLRTDPDVPKHQGLTYFFLDMKSPGIEIKPIKQISGGANFNEVYFTDVRIPDAQRLGAVGQGWQVALTTLMNERASIGGGGGGCNFDSVFDLAKQVSLAGRPAIEDPSVRRKLADWYVQESGLKFTGYRSMTALSRGEIPGPENSIGKLVGAPKQQDMASFALDLLDQHGVIWDSELSEKAGLFQAAYMSSPGLRIAGGTDEIMANIIAERVLGLPQDVRVDKGIPFKDVPTSSS